MDTNYRIARRSSGVERIVPETFRMGDHPGQRMLIGAIPYEGLREDQIDEAAELFRQARTSYASSDYLALYRYEPEV